MKQDTLTTPDSTALATRTWEPDRLVHGNVVIGGAMGVAKAKPCLAPARTA